jgi:predicted RND superfamily exporter protein
MRITTDQLVVAFFIVTGSTVIGFLSNLVSDLPPIRDFGVVAAVGITFTFLIFGIFLPATKVWVDRRRDGWPIPTMSQTPLGSEGSLVGEVLRVGVVASRYAPALLLVTVLVGSAAAGGYATGVDTTFSQEDFLPPAQVPDYLASLPEPFAPSDYTVVATLNFLEDNFETTQGGTATVYVTGGMESDYALESIHRAGRDPPDSFVRDGRYAEASSVVSVIEARAERDPEFRRLVERNDRNDNGVPDDSLGRIYDYLLDSSSRDETLRYLAEDRRSAQVVYTVKADASNSEITADTRAVAERNRLPATATGNTVVFQAVADLIFESAVVSLALALGATVVFLVVIYWLLEGYPSLGVVNTVPIVTAVSMVAGSMRYLSISFNAFTATILALALGLGIDYSVHVVHRFVDERHEHDLWTALDRTIRGTGGALLGSMLTTTFGIGVLALAVLDVLGQFGVLTALSIAYSFLVSVLVLPSVLVLWDRYRRNDPAVPLPKRDGGDEADAPSGSTPAAAD